MRTIFAARPAYLLLLLALLCPALAGDDPAAGDDPLMKALVDELGRSMTLQLEGLEPPYFVQYTVNDVATWRIAATCGAVTVNDQDRSRSLATQVRVGSYDLDNTNFSGGGGRGGFGGRGGGRGGFGGRSAALPIDDDYLAIRQAIWAATDGEYKAAVETLTSKRAYMQDRDFADRPADFARAEPVQSIGPKAAAPVFDREAWARNLERVSGSLLQHPSIQTSDANLTVAAGTTYLVNSEGTRLRYGDTRVLLRIGVEGQAADGARLSDEEIFLARSPAELPGADELVAAAGAMAARLVAALEAGVLERYSGPVLFDGQAAPEIFHALMANGVANNPSPVGAGRQRFSAAESLAQYIGKRILPRSMQVFDDPAAHAEFAGTMLAGHYRFDDEGVPAQRVDIVVNGALKGMATSRSPTREFDASNGHGRSSGRGGSPQASIGCLFVESSEGLAPDALKEALIEAARDQGLEYALRVTSLRGRGFSGRGMGRAVADFMAGRGQGGGGGSAAGDPAYIYKVFVEDGREEPVRGCEFASFDVDDLRDIIAAGDSPAVYNAAGGAAVSVVAPPVIVEELDLFKIEQEREKTPIIAPPHAR